MGVGVLDGGGREPGIRGGDPSRGALSSWATACSSVLESARACLMLLSRRNRWTTINFPLYRVKVSSDLHSERQSLNGHYVVQVHYGARRPGIGAGPLVEAVVARGLSSVSRASSRMFSRGRSSCSRDRVDPERIGLPGPWERSLRGHCRPVLGLSVGRGWPVLLGCTPRDNCPGV